MDVEQFINLVREEVVTKHKKQLLLSGENSIVYDDFGTLVNGYYDSDENVLAVAMGKDVQEWFPVLVHEYCHFLQDNDHFYGLELFEKYSLDFWDVLDPEVKTKPINSKKGKESIQLVEWDCERRVLELIKKYKLDLDPTLYAQKANAYIYFYDVVMKYKRWYSIGSEPYNNPVIVKRMPKRLDDKYLTISEEVVDFIASECNVV